MSKNNVTKEEIERSVYKQFAAIEGEVETITYAEGSRGYVINLCDNLLYGAETYEKIKEDYQNGQGSELHSKMYAIHSSSALVANAFAYFKDSKNELVFNNKKNFCAIEFEKKLAVGVKSAKANIDLFLKDNNDNCFFVESKFLEPLKRKTPKFADSYFAPENQARTERFLNTKTMSFDWAQLTKHFLAIENEAVNNPQEYGRKKIHLIYLYWMPVVGASKTCNIYKEHEKEISVFKEVCASIKEPIKIEFQAFTYNDVFDEWENQESLKSHVEKLRSRYHIEI